MKFLVGASQKPLEISNKGNIDETEPRMSLGRSIGRPLKGERSSQFSFWALASSMLNIKGRLSVNIQR